MGLSKKVDKYPTELFMLVEQVLEQAAEVRMDCGTEAEAKALRFTLYGFATALKEDTKAPRRTEKWGYLAAGLDSLRLSVLREELIFTPRWQTPIAMKAMEFASELAAKTRRRKKEQAAADGMPEPFIPGITSLPNLDLQIKEDSQGLTDETDLANEAVKRLYGLE